MKAKNKAKRLMGRQLDYVRGSQAASHDRQGSRWQSGGYHKPGSNNK